MQRRTPFERLHRRSVGFVEREGATWACFLVTFQEEGRWKGYLSFRRADGEWEDDEVRTADIFLEDSEKAIQGKARELGRPLLSGLLASALHTAEQRRGTEPGLRRWFRNQLARRARELAGEEDDGAAGLSLPRLRSLYESYRVDQVCHFIALVDPPAFEEAVTRVLEGKPFDFHARDRHQFAMMVVEYIEARLPLPPFEVWAEDYLAHRDAYRSYTQALHQGERLP